MAREFRITGKHVLYTLIGFFLVVLAANVIFISLAVRTFPGEKEEKSYLQGLNYNDRLATRSEQAALGWKGTITVASLNGDEATIRLSFKDRAGAPLRGLRISGVLSRPATDANDTIVSFTPIGDGDYEVVVPAGKGVWNLEGLAVDHAGGRFEFSSRLNLE